MMAVGGDPLRMATVSAAEVDHECPLGQQREEPLNVNEVVLIHPGALVDLLPRLLPEHPLPVEDTEGVREAPPQHLRISNRNDGSCARPWTRTRTSATP